MERKILVVDDNVEIREVIRVLLENEGFIVEEAEDGETAIAKAIDMDLIILDVMMPKLDGYEACRKIREVSNAPILFLTAKSMEQDKEQGFLSGGDDYLAKPFSYNELLSRVKALLRRYFVYKGKEESKEDKIIVHDLYIDTTKNYVTKNGEIVNLTEMEYQILLLLAKHPKKIYSNQELYETIWESPYMYSANNTIMVHVRNLRKKLSVDTQKPSYIKTVWGKGYRFD
ncbi:MAG: response regulator transcription factor [Clostridium sp.]